MSVFVKMLTEDEPWESGTTYRAGEYAPKLMLRGAGAGAALASQAMLMKNVNAETECMMANYGSVLKTIFTKEKRSSEQNGSGPGQNYRMIDRKTAGEERS